MQKNFFSTRSAPLLIGAGVSVTLLMGGWTMIGNILHALFGQIADFVPLVMGAVAVKSMDRKDVWPLALGLFSCLTTALIFGLYSVREFLYPPGILFSAIPADYPIIYTEYVKEAAGGIAYHVIVTMIPGLANRFPNSSADFVLDMTSLILLGVTIVFWVAYFQSPLCPRTEPKRKKRTVPRAYHPTEE